MKKPERILHVLGSLNMGGAETLLMNIYRNIDRNKFQFDFVVHGEDIGKYEEEITSLGGKIYHIDKYKVYNHFKYKKIWNNFFKEHQEYKIIHGHMRSTASIYLKIAKKYNLKTICHSHSISNGTGIKSVIKKVLQRNIPKYSDYMLGCSTMANDWLYGKTNSASDRCFVLTNGIDNKKFIFDVKTRNDLRKKYHLTGKTVVGHIGRFVEAKNHVFMIEIIKKLVEYDNKYMLLLVGDGENKPDIMERVKKYNLDENVIFFDSSEFVYKYYQMMDIFVFPSRYEGLGLVAIEAQTSGLPTIISDKVPKDVIISKETKVLPITDVDIWVNNIINAKKDRIKDINYDKYSIEKTTSELVKIYNMLD